MKGVAALVAISMAMSSIYTQGSVECSSSTLLTAYGLTSQSASVVTNGTCSKFFSTNGACVPPGEIIKELKQHQTWLKQQAMLAVEMNYQYINATIYFQTLNGLINSETVVPQNESWFDSIVNAIKSIANRATKLFGQTVNWVKSVFSSANGKINPCFQAWANITNGAICTLGSSSNVQKNENLQNLNAPLAIQVDKQKTGKALSSCSALIDTYCSLTHGISISNSAMPFNTTVQWGDGSISVAGCTAFRDSYNGTQSQSTREALYVDLFATNNIPFVLSREAINNIGAFLTALTPAAKPETFTQVQKRNNGVGISIYSLASGVGLDILDVGMNSGQPKITYGASLFAICAVFLSSFLHIL